MDDTSVAGEVSGNEGPQITYVSGCTSRGVAIHGLHITVATATHRLRTGQVMFAIRSHDFRNIPYYAWGNAVWATEEGTGFIERVRSELVWCCPFGPFLA